MADAPERQGLEHRYAPFWCEENVWHLCGEERFSRARAQVAFISNERGHAALWAQRAAREPGEAVLWDYHVLLLAEQGSSWLVWDLDTLAGFPAPLADYLEETFWPFLGGHPAVAARLNRYAPRFRLVEAARYRAEFSSDRSHMLSAAGRWTRPPPPWPMILREGHPSFLRWTRMKDALGDTLDLGQLRAGFGGSASR